MEKNNAQLAEELAEIAIEKRANNALQQLWERLMSLPPAQRNAIIGGLLGGAGTGAVSAATGGNAILDAILGAGLGASAGYGGTRAYRHITGEDQIPSKGMAQNWQEVEKALPVGQAENAARAAVTGGAVAGAGSLGGLYVDHVNRQLEGFRGARTKAPM